jgi:hypothetical protein
LSWFVCSDEWNKLFSKVICVEFWSWKNVKGYVECNINLLTKYKPQ